jgi:hypothetical protein
MKIYFKITIISLFLLFSINEIKSQSTDKMIIIIIDGARYTETLGDPSHSYTPEMWNLASQGTVVEQFMNDGFTYTSRAIPALWCGTWTDVRDTTYENSSTRYAVKPTLFEYYRKQRNMPEEECVYVLIELESLWLPSFNSHYGPDFWPKFHSVGHSDSEVAEQAKIVIDELHPHLMWVYLADVDHAGHSGNWSEYTSAISNADAIVGDLWRYIQADPFYKDATTLFITNDHGRHDNQHGGFQGHGDNCNGCRHIEFLAVGPSIKENYVSQITRNTPDMAVTAAYLLGVEPEYATGNIMQEIFKPNGVEEEFNQITNMDNYPNPFHSSTNIRFHLLKSGQVNMTIFDITGKEIYTIHNFNANRGENTLIWDATDKQGKQVNPGIYFYQLQSAGQEKVGKLLLLSDNID